MEGEASKRKREESSNGNGAEVVQQPAAKVPRPSPPQQEPSYGPAGVPYTQPHLLINYFARHHPTDIALVSPNEDTLPTCLNTINQYDAALERSESLANNLGARPLSNVLLQRFERMFDGPPKVVFWTGPEMDPPTFTWLDILGASSSLPAEAITEGEHKGQRYIDLKISNCDVRVTLEEWQMCRSGMLQNIMPSRPIAMDEAKELVTLDILEETINKIISLADQVAARGRQFNHRLRGRRDANFTRAAAVAAGRTDSGVDLAVVDGPIKFTETRAELVKLFQANRRELLRSDHTKSPQHRSSGSHNATNAGSPVVIQPTKGTPSHHPRSSYQNNKSSSRPRRPPPPPPNDSPFKQEMTARIDILPKGAPINPPCDRCRRLNMECVKNLTACAGCTRKHCKCNWNDAKEEEMRGEREYTEDSWGDSVPRDPKDPYWDEDKPVEADEEMDRDSHKPDEWNQNAREEEGGKLPASGKDVEESQRLFVSPSQPGQTESSVAEEIPVTTIISGGEPEAA